MKKIKIIYQDKKFTDYDKLYAAANEFIRLFHIEKGNLKYIDSRSMKCRIKGEISQEHLEELKKKDLSQIIAINILPDQSELEREFLLLRDTIGERIEQNLIQADNLLKEACRLSEQYGFPFYSPISHLAQSYIPDSINKAYKDLDEDFIYDKIGLSASDIEYGGGWQHSAVC